MEKNDNQLNQFKKYINQFVEISDKDWKKYLSIIKPVPLNKGEFFIRADKQDLRLGFIIKGLLRTYFTSESGDEFTTDFCKENEITANYNIFSAGQDSMHCSEALEECLILEFDYKDLIKISEESTALKELKDKLIDLYFSEKVIREKELLSLNAEDKYRYFIIKYKDILKRIQQYHIASYLGITPEALSRIKRNLK